MHATQILSLPPFSQYSSMAYLGIAMAAFLVVFVTKIWQLLIVVVWRPYQLKKCFEKQGIRGPPYKLLYGSFKEMKELGKHVKDMVLDVHSNDITPRVLPHYHKWSSQYGEIFVYWFQMQPRISIGDPEMAKQMLSNKFGFYEKPEARPAVLSLAGKGLILLEGLDWVRHRRILTPFFTNDKLKLMMHRMVECCMNMTDEWQTKALQEKSFTIEMSTAFKMLTADIIAHTAFGSSYLQGREAFKAQEELQKFIVESTTNIFIPASQYLPTPANIRLWRLDRKLTNSLRRIVESRMKSNNPDGCFGDDILGLMIEASRTGETKAKLDMDEIIEECRTFFFAGHETTSNLLTWTIFLLSTHKDWQERLRQEVLEECGVSPPNNADNLSKLKQVNMVLLEALRLYCPIIEMIRKAPEDMKLGNFDIPKGTSFAIPITMIHRNKKYWGEDANQFNPLRFTNGVSKAATHPNALLAFSLGPRNCIGQNFSMMEAKTVVALLLQRFSFSLSPEYKHAPVNFITLHPQYGLPVIFKPLDL